jgi:catalase
MRTRKVALLAASGVRYADVEQARTALCGAGGLVEVVSHALGSILSLEGRPIAVDKTWRTASSVLYDALFVPGGEESIASLRALGDPVHYVREAFRHAKPIGASNEGVELLALADLPEIALASAKQRSKVTVSRGVVSAFGDDLSAFGAELVTAICEHRHHDRAVDRMPA